jgi:uncharacterized membrane protein
MNKIPGQKIALLAYITIFGALMAMSMNNEPQHSFARFHTRQAFGLHLLFHALVLVLPYWIGLYGLLAIYLVYLIFIAFGITDALRGKHRLLPVVGTYFQRWFTFVS